MNVVVRVQHHPERKNILPRLLSGLDGLKVDVFSHKADPPNPWEGYHACLNAPTEASHILVIQDDTLVCRNFGQAVHEVAQANPHTPVCLYLGGLPARTAREAKKVMMSRRGNYVQIAMRDFVPVVAVLWPTEKAREFISWAGETAHSLPGTPKPRSDDAVVGAWARWTKQTVLATVPSLVQHPDDVASTIKRRNHSGRDRGRTALFWIGDDDPLAIRW